MRNLKKILALALALVMSLSLMATANAFTDDDSITDTYETAVTVLSGLKVFQGYDDGTFQPKGAITRAEVAAIIYRIVTGDVADTQVGIYADYNKFDDVASTSWYAGYVNFCANAEYIKGYDARTFGPNDPVTGYQALAMILRALGYDKNGEFTGTNWTIQTAAVGEQRGITKNITAGTLGVPATREVVAEILFRAILVPTVTYTPAFGYQTVDANGDDNTSLGYDTFGLESIEGVVVANEYADLYSDSPLRAGRTELDVDGDSYVIDYASTLEDIGEARYAYVTGSTVLALGDAGNTVWETGDEADIDGDSAFEDASGMERNNSTEYFLNFDGGSTYEASDWRIRYVINQVRWTVTAATEARARAAFEDYFGIDGDASTVSATRDGNEWTITYNAAANNEYSVTRRPGQTLTAQDINCMREIFYSADRFETHGYVLGEVYVGTQSLDDISDDRDVSWNAFVDQYIEVKTNGVDIDGNENGNWLKVVDNDGDGIADVVMKTVYTMAGIEDIDGDDELELTAVDASMNDGDDINAVADDASIVSDDDLSEGDIVYYAVIDGNAQTYLADMVTAEIDRVNRNTLTATTTDGDEYVQSGVHNHVVWNGYVDGVRNLEGDISYDLYLDKYGYLAVFTESANASEFVLLTDGWYDRLRGGDEYAAMVWNGEELVDTDITEGGELFIDRSNTNNNNWDALRYFEGVNYVDPIADDNIHTIVAALSEDGTLIPVDDLYRYREEVVMVGMGTTEDAIPDRDRQVGTIYDTDRNGAYADARGDADVRALSTTVYYYVYNTNNGTIVREYVGYDNTPDLGNDAWKVENVYAVASRATDANANRYYTAEIVVVELKDGYAELDAEEIFLVDLPEAINSVGTELARVIRADGTVDEVMIDLDKSELWADEYREYDPAWGKYIVPGLYYMWESADEADVYVIERMTPWEIADSNYMVGTVNKDDATGATNWTSVDTYALSIDPVDPWFSFGTVATGEDSAKNVDSSSYYTLSYDVDSWDQWINGNVELDADSYTAALSDNLSRSAVLRQDVRGQEANYVLVARNSSDEILYAISFRYEDDFVDATDDDLFTQFVWMINTPAQVIVENNVADALDLYNDFGTVTSENLNSAKSLLSIMENAFNAPDSAATSAQMKMLSDAIAVLRIDIAAVEDADLSVETFTVAFDTWLEDMTSTYNWTEGMQDAAEAALAQYLADTDADDLDPDLFTTYEADATHNPMYAAALEIYNALTAATGRIDAAAITATNTEAAALDAAEEAAKAAIDAASTVDAVAAGEQIYADAYNKVWTDRVAGARTKIEALEGDSFTNYSAIQEADFEALANLLPSESTVYTSDRIVAQDLDGNVTVEITLSYVAYGDVAADADSTSTVTINVINQYRADGN